MSKSSAFNLYLFLFGLGIHCIQGQAAPASATQTPPAASAPLPSLSDDDEKPFDNNKTPLSDQDFLLLSKNGYRVQPDGTIRPPGSARPVGNSEVQLILDELTGRERMQAMLRLNVIFNQYGTKNLPEDPLQEVRRIGRQNWPVLPARVRSDLRSYFSARELEAMDSGLRPIRVPQSWLPLEAPGPYSVTDSTASEILAAPPAEIPSAAPAPKLPEASVPVSSTTTTAAVAAGTTSAKTYAFQTAPAEPPRLVPAAAPAAPPGISGAPPASPPAFPSLPPSGAGASTFATPPALSALSADYPDLPPPAFEKFLADAPYNRDVKALLAKISAHAPSEARRLALGLVAKNLPRITIDPQQAGTERYAQTLRVNSDPNLPAQYIIALNPGPAVFTEKKLLFESKEFLMPGATQYYAALGAAPPAIQALGQESSPGRTMIEDRGFARKFDDGSRRLIYSPEEMAGTLLHELLTLDARMRRLDADPYRSELRSRFFQFAFYQKLKEETGTRPLLDRALQTEYDEWLNRPEDYWDDVLQAEAAPARAAVAPDLSGPQDSRNAWRRNYDLSFLKKAGLLSGAAPKQGAVAADFVASPSDETERIVAAELQLLGEPSPAGKEWIAEEGRLRETLHEKK